MGEGPRDLAHHPAAAAARQRNEARLCDAQNPQPSQGRPALQRHRRRGGRDPHSSSALTRVFTQPRSNRDITEKCDRVSEFGAQASIGRSQAVMTVRRLRTAGVLFIHTTAVDSNIRGAPYNAGEQCVAAPDPLACHTDRHTVSVAANWSQTWASSHDILFSVLQHSRAYCKL